MTCSHTHDIGRVGNADNDHWFCGQCKAHRVHGDWIGKRAWEALFAIKDERDALENAEYEICFAVKALGMIMQLDLGEEICMAAGMAQAGLLKLTKCENGATGGEAGNGGGA